jgi:hypothetical protein
MWGTWLQSNQSQTTEKTHASLWGCHWRRLVDGGGPGHLAKQIWCRLSDVDPNVDLRIGLSVRASPAWHLNQAPNFLFRRRLSFFTSPFLFSTPAVHPKSKLPNSNRLLRTSSSSTSTLHSPTVQEHLAGGSEEREEGEVRGLPASAWHSRRPCPRRGGSWPCIARLPP